MNALSISIHDESNLGDKSCNPCLYFDDMKGFPRVDAWDVNWIYERGNLLLGGGGMVHGLLTQLIEYVPRLPSRNLIAWGLGHNQHGESYVNYRNVLSGFDLVGVRDYKTAHVKGWDYVPCVSCMSPAFDAEYPPPVHPFVVYQHFDNPIKLRGAHHMIPTMTNEVPTLSDVLAFLASGGTVITNSYHGAYWALLLNRGVLIYKPFTSRFHDFEVQPKFCDESNWKRVNVVQAGSEFLKRCREYNLKFHEKVVNLLGVENISPTPDSGATV